MSGSFTFEDASKPAPPSGAFSFEDAAQPAQGSGVISNLGAGVNRMIGAPVDVVNAGLNLFGAGSAEPVGGYKWIERQLGHVGVPEAQAVTPAEKTAQTIGEAVGSTVLPGIGAEAALARGAETMAPAARAVLEALRGGSTTAPAANVARNVALGAASGAGQVGGEAVAPKGWEPTFGMFGSIIGGLPVGAGEAAYRWVASRPSLETQAADRMLNAATDRNAVLGTLSNEPLSQVPGSRPTVPEATNDPGLLQLQNWARNQQPESFATRAAENNAARVGEINAIAPTSPTTPGHYFTDRLDQMRAAENAVVDAATARAGELQGSLGVPPAQEQIGATARASITSNYAPALAAAEQGDVAARQRLEQAAQGIGGNLQAEDTDTARQQYGAQLGQFVQEGRDARARQEAALWNAARQNGDLVFDQEPAVAAVGNARSAIVPEGGDRLTPAEGTLYETIEGWDQPQDFDTIKAMRSNIGDAADAAFRGGDRRAGARLLTVRNGLDQSIENAIDSRVAQERAAVQGGALDPSRTFEAALLRDRNEWQAARAGQRPGGVLANTGPGVAANVPSGTPAVPGAVGAAGEASAGREPIAGDQGMAPAPGSTVDRYSAARAFTRETHQIFDQTPAGSVIARGPYGAPEKLARSRVPGQFANTSTQQVENARNFEAAVGGKPEAIAALQDYLAFDLKNAAWNADTGRLNGAAFQKWMRTHDGLMTIYPELREQFGNFANAQRALDETQAARATLDKQLSAALGDSNATVMGQYFRRGPAGADAMDRYVRETGNSPAAQQAMADHITNDFLDRVVPGGQFNRAAFRSWRAANDAALSRVPGLAARFDNVDAAQAAAADAIAARAQKVSDFQDSAARFWLRGTDPNTAVTNALSKRAGNDAVQNMRDLVDMTRSDPAAAASLKRSVVDWLLNKGQTGKEAGQTGTDYLKIQGMQDLINNNREALRQVFTPDEMKRLDAVAADLKMSDRSISGSKPPIGPGTARDVFAGNRFGPKATTALRFMASKMPRVLAGAAGYGAFGYEGALTAYASVGALHDLATVMRAAREDKIQNLIIGAVLDPDQFRVLSRKATPANIEPLTRQLARRIAQSAASAAMLQGATP